MLLRNSVCSFKTSKLLFGRNNRTWRECLVCKGSTVASHQTNWHNKRMLRKGYYGLRDFSWIENYKLECVSKFRKFTEKHPFWSPFLISCRPLAGNFVGKRIQHKYFPLNFAKMLRTPSLRKPDDCFWKTSRLILCYELVISYVKHLFIAGVSFPIQYIKKIRHEISFSWVCKTNLQRSVISRHRINH